MDEHGLVRRTFDTGEVVLSYAEIESAGPSLVLIHGGGDSRHVFDSVSADLSRSHHLYAIDLRGHGSSGRVAGRYRPEHYAKDMVAFLAAVSGQACVLGHSLGGWVALVAAKFRPDLVTGLILADPPLNIARFLVEEGSAEQLHFWHGIRDQLKLAEAGTTAGLTDPDVILYHAEGRLDEYVEEVDIDRILAALRCPTLILQADPACGGKITDDEAVRAQRLLHNGSYSRFPGFGHDLGLTDLDSAPPITAAVTRFLGTIGP